MTKRKAVGKKSVKKAGRKTGAGAVGPLVPQSHGGAIRPGRPLHPVAGTGRPPDRIRAALRDKLALAIPRLWADYGAGRIDALGFANFLAKYGLGDKELVIASTEAAAFFDCVHTAVLELGGPDMAERVKTRAIQLIEAKA